MVAPPWRKAGTMDIVAHSAERRELAQRESYAYGAARGMLAKAAGSNRDRPARALKIALDTLTRWASSCDAIAQAGQREEPATADTRWRLTPKGQAAAEALAARRSA